MSRIHKSTTRHQRWCGDASSYRSGFRAGVISLIFGLCVFNSSAPSATQLLDVLKTTASTSSSSSTLNLPPATKKVVLNIGTNVDPILPQKRDGPCALTIAFEPIVPEQIPKHPQIMVVPAAVSDRSSLSTMYVYNKNAVSSSLSQANQKSWWNENPGEPRIVPVVTLQEVLRSIPNDVEITMLDTDMQGYDFQTVASAIAEIRARPIRYLKTETHLNNVEYGYQGTDNDLCRQWLPMMSQAGYQLVGNEVGGQRNAVPGYTSTAEAEESCRTGKPAPYMELDAYWALLLDGDDPAVPTENLDAFDYNKLKENKERPFTVAEYSACLPSAGSER